MTDPETLFARAEAALDESDLAAAEKLARAGLAECTRLQRPPAATVPGLFVLAAVHADRLEDDAALAHLAQVRAHDPEHGDAVLLEARLRLARWEFAAAAELLAPWPADTDDAAVVHLRATLAELQGRDAEADRLYAQAAALDAEDFPAPVRIGDDEVHELLQETIAALPAEVVATFRNLTVDLLPVPDRALHGDVDPQILGLYAGTPVGDGEAAPMRLPDRVYIFRRNIERIAANRDELVSELRITLLHELGHHLGWDEDDLAERGLG